MNRETTPLLFQNFATTRGCCSALMQDQVCPRFKKTTTDLHRDLFLLISIVFRSHVRARTRSSGSPTPPLGRPPKSSIWGDSKCTLFLSVQDMTERVDRETIGQYVQCICMLCNTRVTHTEKLPHLKVVKESECVSKGRTCICFVLVHV